MKWIQRFFAWFWRKVLRRTGYKAFVDGNLISGCGECINNKILRLHTLPAHYCAVSFRKSGDPEVIMDPFDIPEFCPCKAMEER